MTTLELLMFGIDPAVHRLAVSRRSRAAGSIVGLAFAVGLSAVAVAAPPPQLGPGGGGPGGGGAGPEEEACSGRAVGDACTLPNRQLGTCGDSTCNRLDYSGGSPPKAVEEACVVCKAGGGHGAGPSLGSGGAPAGEDGGSDADGSAGPSGSGADSGPGKDPPESSSRCRVTSSQDPIGALALLAVLGLGLGLRRRELRESNLVR